MEEARTIHRDAVEVGPESAADGPALGPSGPVAFGWEVRHSTPGFPLMVASSRLGPEGEVLVKPEQHTLLVATLAQLEPRSQAQSGPRPDIDTSRDTSSSRPTAGEVRRSEMNLELAIAALGCLVLALGHTTIGLRWILPNLTRGSLPSTPFGSPAMTLGMVRFTWHVVSVLLVGFGILLMALAWVPDADPRTLLLRWFAALWLAATALACWNARRRPSSLLRLPVPLVFVVIALMCWTAST